MSNDEQEIQDLPGDSVEATTPEATDVAAAAPSPTEDSPEDILALIDGIESALAADSAHLAASPVEPPFDVGPPSPASPLPGKLLLDADGRPRADLDDDNLPAALRPARIPGELAAEATVASSRSAPETPAARSSVRPAGYATRADSFPPPRRLEPVPMPRRVHLDAAPRSAGPIPRVLGSTRDVLAKFRWGA